MKKTGCFLIVLVLAAIGIGLGGWYVGGMNRAVRLHEDVKGAWKDVDVQLQRRYDLVPNLVETVKGYAAHEKELFADVTRMRSQWAAASSPGEKIQAAAGLEGAIARLLMVVENYPELKASQNFGDLQVQLEGTENRIAVARHRYNDAVRGFNKYQREFFGRYFCKKSGLTEPGSYFELTTEKAREAPKVEF